ncbi:MAG TPA: HAMP domain-containing sensor histidine kinase, partial [Gammaproteobacteria bacterium]|nr:HAMP domain-containing sensor histidine kinase [Gammaproteobacteria bacterium]
FFSGDKELIHLNIKEDFQFYGNELLTIHVLFNLIKNSLYYIKSARKGEITIWLTVNDSFNCLHFKDTGKGVSQEILPHIFDLFYSKTSQGYGLGLAFCAMVMKSYSGHIKCESVEGSYIEFILKFLKIKEV